MIGTGEVLPETTKKWFGTSISRKSGVSEIKIKRWFSKLERIDDNKTKLTMLVDVDFSLAYVPTSISNYAERTFAEEGMK